MNWKTGLGWAVFVCGVLGIVFVFSSPIGYILQSLTSLFELLLSPKLWALIPVGITLYYGWQLAHRDSENREKAHIEARWILKEEYLWFDSDRILALISTLERWKDDETKNLIRELRDIPEKIPPKKKK